MGFKSRIFGEILILCVLLILDTRNIVNGCKLFWADGTEIPLNPPLVFVVLEAISDDESPGLLSAFSIEDINSVALDQTLESKYLDYTYDDTALNIWLSGTYENWKRNEDESFVAPKVALQLDCSPAVVVVVEFRTEITNFKNRYPPEFPESVYELELPMPLPAGYAIVGECGEIIEVTDYDYHSRYRSNVVFSLKDTTEDLEVSALKRDGKKWAVILKTTNTFRIKEPLTITLIAHDVPPGGETGIEHTSEVDITIVPDIAASTPASPLFEMPIYILDIKQEEDIKPVISTLVEGATADYEVELVYSHGENLEQFFDIDTDGAVITLTPDKSLASTEFSGNFGILILEAKHPGTSRIGKTVIHVTLPGNYVTPPPTSTTETTMLPCSCPTEETTYTADTTKATEEITQCPEVTSPTEVTCPDVTCPEITGTTETTMLPCSCPTEETTYTADTTKATEEITQCPEVTSPTEVTCPDVTCPDVTCPDVTCPDVTCPDVTCPEITGTTESCVCSTEHTSVPGTSGTTTTTVNKPTCEPCDCTPGTPESSAAPPQEIIIYFTDPEAKVYIYEQQMGYIKTMSAYCIPECKIKYEIVAGPLSSSLIIDHEKGHINVTENIKESGLFDVKATAEVDGINYDKTATVHLNVITLQPCQNGSSWTKALTVKPVQEKLQQPLLVEKCDFIKGCECSIVRVIPEKARDYFTDGGVVELITSIDRDDTELFPDQSNTYIILHVELSCESDENTISKFWDKRSRSVIDNIGTIEYDESRTVIVLQIEDENDNRPAFDITSITVGYPSAEIVHQLMPPYLMKVQATDADFGENAIIKYSLMPNDQFFIHQDTGVIYPVAEAFMYEDTQFTVYANDSEGAGKPLEVNVTILTPDNLLVVRQRGSVLEDVNAVIDTISSTTSYNIKLLSAAVIASDTVVNDAVHKKDDDGQLPNLKSMKESSDSVLQLIIYGLDFEEKPVSYSDIQNGLGGEFTSESWTASNSNGTEPNQSVDTILLIAVIILASIILVLLGGAGVAYLYYVRSRRNNDDDYYNKILNGSGKSSISEVDEDALAHAIEEKRDYENEQLSSNTEVIQPSAPLSFHLSSTKPEQDFINVIEPNEFNQGTTDVKNTANNGNGGEHQDDNIVKSRKSIVTFNDNVERIEIEEV